MKYIPRLLRELNVDLRNQRKKSGLTISQASGLCGIDESTWKKLERGLISPSEELKKKLGRAFKLSEILSASPVDVVDKQVVSGEGYVTRTSHEFLSFDPVLPRQNNTLNVIDFFCGAGGLSHGFSELSDYQVTCGLDLLADRVKTFHANNPFATAIQGDIRTVDFGYLKEIADQPTVMVGGPPCQGFSSIRPFRNLTESDQRNSLPEQYLLAVARMCPEWVVFENVVGILSHKKGNVFDQVLDGLKGLGYFVDYKVINSAELGVPQSRERVYVIARRNNKPFDWLLPSHRIDGSSMAKKHHPTLERSPLFIGNLPPPITVEEAIYDLPSLESGGASDSYMGDPITDYQAYIRDNAEKLTLHFATKHTEKMMDIIRLAGHNRQALPEHMTSSGFSSCYSRLHADRPSTTITVNFVNPSSNRCIHPVQDRALTPREGARLQGFKDTYIFQGSKTQITKQIGNAVPPIISRKIAEMILNNL